MESLIDALPLQSLYLAVPDAMASWAREHGLNSTVLAWLAVALLLGASKTQTAAFLGISRQTVHKYCRFVSLLPAAKWLAQVRDLLIMNPGLNQPTKEV